MQMMAPRADEEAVLSTFTGLRDLRDELVTAVLQLRVFRFYYLNFLWE